MMKKWIIRIPSLLLIAYAGSYSLLSAMGNYQGSQSGEIRYEGAAAVTDLLLWQPKGTWYQSHFLSVDGETIRRGNRLGYFYSPLIVLDQALFHKTMNVGDTQGRHETNEADPSGPDVR